MGGNVMLFGMTNFITLFFIAFLSVAAAQEDTGSFSG